MAANTRRLEVRTTTAFHEMSDIITASMIRNRAGGDVQMSLTLGPRGFEDYQGLDDFVQFIRFFHTDDFVFGGRIAHLDSDRDTNIVSVTLEGRALALKEIKNTIIIDVSDSQFTSPINYFNAAGGTEIDISSIVFLLFDRFIKDFGVPARMESNLADFFDIDGIDSGGNPVPSSATGVTLKTFEWENSGNGLMEIISQLAEAAGFWHWGFLSPDGANKWTFRFKKPSETSVTKYTTRRKATDPYIEKLKGSREPRDVPSAIHITGAYDALSRSRLTYLIKNTTVDFGTFTQQEYFSFCKDATTAQNLADGIFAEYKIIQPRYAATIRNVPITLDDPKSQIKLSTEQGALHIARLESVTYALDEIISSVLQLGDNAGKDICNFIRDSVEGHLSKINRPTTTDDTEVAFYGQGIELFKVITVNAGSPNTFDIQRVKSDGIATYGPLESGVGTMLTHSNFLSANTIVEVARFSQNDDIATSDLKIINILQISTT